MLVGGTFWTIDTMFYSIPKEKNVAKIVYFYLLTSTMRHPFHIRVYARPDFQVFNLGLGYSEYRKAA